MKILLFHPWIKSKGGAEKLILEYVKRSRHKIDILTWFYNPSMTFEEYKKLRVIPIFPDWVDSISRSFLFRGAFFGIIGNLIKVLKDYTDNYDIILISTAGIAETILTRYNGKTPVVLYVHTPLRATYKYDIIYNFKNRFRKLLFTKYYYKLGIALYNLWEKHVWKKVHFAIFNSKLSLKRALDKKLIDVNKTKVIYPGVDVDIPAGNYEDYFLYVGRFGMAKRQEVVLMAWKLFTKKYKDYKLILTGGLENKRFFRYLNILKSNLRLKNVEFIINAPWKEIVELHSNALCEIQIPFMEDFGIAPFEAIVAGKPLIATDSMGAMEIIGNLSSVIKVKEHIDRVTLARRLYGAMEHFVKNKDYYIEEAKRNREIIKKLDLSWDRFAREMDKTLEVINY